MSREIKFRVWDTLSKKMIPFEEIWFKPQGLKCEQWNAIIRTKGVAFSKTDSCNGELMQFTGLVDKWKKEIYEGDIVKIHNMEHTWRNPAPSFDWRILEVKWNKYTWAFNNSVLYKPFSDYDLSSGEPFEIEILGNIYQNKDILQ